VRFLILLVTIATIFVSGCALVPQSPIPLAAESITATSGKVGVAMTKIPAPNTYFPGATCLLCIGVAEMAHNQLSAHVKTLPIEDLAALKNAVIAQLKQRGVNAIAITDDIDIAGLPNSDAKGENLPTKDFRALKAKYGIDRLFLVAINSFGVFRPYAAYVPTGVPHALVSGSANIIDLQTNTYNWYSPIVVQRTAQGVWDEPPKFPGITNAFYQVIELTKDAVLNPLK
jgi:hypothetical protein